MTTCPEKDVPAASGRRASSSRASTTACSTRATAHWPISRPVTATTRPGTTTSDDARRRLGRGRPVAHGRGRPPGLLSSSPLGAERVSGGARIGTVRVEVVAADRLRDLLALHVAHRREPVEHRDDDVRRRRPRSGGAARRGCRRSRSRRCRAAMNGCGTNRAIWSGTAFMKSVTATIGPSASCELLGHVRGAGRLVGCSRFQRSTLSASSRSSL